MAGNVFNEKDSMDINELASLNNDISPELIEQLQQKIAKDAESLSGESPKPAFNTADDTTLFEEPGAALKEESTAPQPEEQKAEEPKPAEKKDIQLEKNFDDNFIKKYKAKLNKQKQGEAGETPDEASKSISESVFSGVPEQKQPEDNNDINTISNGNITERALTKEQKEYNDSLDLLDNNIKYSKYVIYIDPENVDFIESLTVKERKNLINRILREQDDIAITKQRFKIIQTVIRHAIVAILTISISIPVIYFTINASLETTINNYRRSESIFQTLYKERGKIKNIR